LCAGVSLVTFFLIEESKNAVKLQMSAKHALIRPQELTEEYPSPKVEKFIYPYSVIPGGVRNREELINSIAGDRVVAAHYADFNVSEAKIIRAEETRSLYVSYRIKNKIYWTSKKAKIPKGEPLITDGRCEARARCGNRVSAFQLEPIGKEEPILESLDLPELPQISQFVPSFENDRIALELPSPPQQLEPIAESTAPSEILRTPDIINPSNYRRNYWMWPYPYRPLIVLYPHQSVPESDSFSLLFLGLIFVGVFRLIHHR